MRSRVGLGLALLFVSSHALAQPVPERVDDGWQNPGKAADPPVIPAPVPEPDPAPPTAERIHETAQDARMRELEERIARDEKKLRRLQERTSLFDHLTLQSYIQPQFLLQSYNSAASPNRINGQLPPGIGPNDTIAKTDGTTTNGTFFRIRRARIRSTYETDVMRFLLHIDAFPLGGIGPGIGTILRDATAAGIARWTPAVRTEFTAGLMAVPFRREILEWSVNRPFIERTWFIQNTFPTERDYGVHAKTIALSDRLVVDVSMINGARLGEKTFVALPDLSRAKDLVAYATYRLGFVTLGTSGYYGHGQIVARAERSPAFTILPAACGQAASGGNLSHCGLSGFVEFSGMDHDHRLDSAGRPDRDP